MLEEPSGLERHLQPLFSWLIGGVLCQVLAYVSRVRDIGCEVDEDKFSLEDVESNIVRCPDQAAAQKMVDGEQVQNCSRQHALGCLDAAQSDGQCVSVHSRRMFKR